MGGVGSVAMRITVVKLGGSLITKKDRPNTPHQDAIKGIARAIKRSGLPNRNRKLFLVHGGGSFGHYYASKYGLSSNTFSKIDPMAVAQTCMSMHDLHTIVLDTLTKAGVNCVTLSASESMDSKLTGFSEDARKRINDYFGSGLVPITFGNVVVRNKRALIISGDLLCKAIARDFPVDKAIFAMDVDGIFRSSKMEGEILPLIDASVKIESLPRKLDVTGGVANKIKSGFELSRLGAEVFFLNGLKPKRLLDCLLDTDSIKATRISKA